MNRTMLHLVPTTHWDREWYRVLGEFQFHFAELMDRALALLQSGKLRCFHTDGQSSIVAEYLEARPARRATVRRLARQGRLEIGPWYTLSDMLLPSGEALLRNLELGVGLARRLGGRTGIPYAPDAFGHSADIPKILRHLGFDAYFFCRGLGHHLPQLRSEFRWRADDGSEVLAIAGLADVFDPPFDARGRWICGAYALGMDLPEEPTAFAERIRLIRLHAERYATTGQLLVMTGGDHLLPQAHLAASVARFNRSPSEARCRQSTLADYVRRLRACRLRLPAVAGELADGKMYWILNGTGSSRPRLKRLNWECQHLLEGWVEPWCAFLSTPARLNQAAFVEKAWKLLLQNQAHDSLCGCGIDAVHREMEARFDTIRRLGARLLLRSARQCAGDTALPQRMPVADAECFAVLFCSAQSWPADGPWIVPLHHPVGTDLRDYALYDEEGRELAMTVVSRSAAADTNGPFLPAGDDVCLATTTVALDTLVIPAYGYRILQCRKSKARRGPLPAAAPVLRNEHLEIVVDRRGTLTAVYRHGGKTLRCRQLLDFEDEADVGGEYHFRPLAGDRPIRPTPGDFSWRWLVCTPAIQRLQLDRWLDCPVAHDPAARRRRRRTERLPIRSTLTLRRGAACLEISTAIDNRCRDHRLRVAFPLPFAIRSYAAQTQFGHIRHSLALPQAKGWREPPSRCRRNYGWLSFHDSRTGLALTLLPQGIHEHEADKASVRLTLLRCVGEIGEGGPALPSPEAQNLGEHRCDYALFFHPSRIAPANARERELARLARAPRAWALPAGARPPPNRRAASFLELRSNTLLLSSVRPGTTKGSLLIRLYNPSDRPGAGALASDLALRDARSIRYAGAVPRKAGSVSLARLAVPPRGIAVIEARIGTVAQRGPPCQRCNH